VGPASEAEVAAPVFGAIHQLFGDKKEAGLSTRFLFTCKT